LVGLSGLPVPQKLTRKQKQKIAKHKRMDRQAYKRLAKRRRELFAADMAVYAERAAQERAADET
jgi:hypothetical protein